MLYRKAPTRPVQMLLRVVTLTGAGAVTGIVACSSGSGSTFAGSVVVPHDGGVDEFEGSSSGGFYCGDSSCGIDTGTDATDATPDSATEAASDGATDATSDGLLGLVPPDSGIE